MRRARLSSLGKELGEDSADMALCLCTRRVVWHLPDAFKLRLVVEMLVAVSASLHFGLVDGMDSDSGQEVPSSLVLVGFSKGAAVSPEKHREAQPKAFPKTPSGGTECSDA